MERGGYDTKMGIGESEREGTQKTHHICSALLFVLTFLPSVYKLVMSN